MIWLHPTIVVVAHIDFSGKTTFVCTTYGGNLSDECTVKNGVRHRGISSGILFKFYQNEVISDISKLAAGCTSTCSKVNILGYTNDLLLIAPTARRYNYCSIFFTSKLYALPLQVNVRKSCNIVFGHSNKKSVNKLDYEQPPLRQVWKLPT